MEILLNENNDDEHISKCLRIMIPQMNIQVIILINLVI